MLHVKKSSIEVTIGVIEYMASVEYGFNAPVTMSDDPTERDDTELVYHRILKCQAYNTETGSNYFVTDQDELNMIDDWVNWEDEFNTL